MFYVYVLKSQRDGKIYSGHCNDLKKRIADHNAGLVKSTARRRPFQLLYYEACNILYDAVKREKSFKTGFGRAYLKRRISDL